MSLLDFLGTVLVLAFVLGGLVWALAVANRSGTPASSGEHDVAPRRAYRDQGTGEWIEP
ncbi:hypothetical protein [Streptacidiphilus rugosus]|uniref:hypothetical protein n=1 Tax=Streptacidiphilus rugosus TaxID=405783 RepID=UPI000AD9504F|nr:hypothetical protein [Streptacidiphilus rugosus]